MTHLVYYLEDDENISTIVTKALDSIGLVVKTFDDYRLFLDALKLEKPKLILLDLMLPLIDGSEVLKHIKSKQSTKTIPTMVISAKITDYDRVKCFDYGADDYLSKPFSVLELIARVKNILKRKFLDGEVYKCYDIVLDDYDKTVLKKGVNIDLTYKEFELLKFLIINEGKPLRRESILNEVWGHGNAENTRTVDMHIKSLRKKVFTEDDDAIETMFKLGYKFVYSINK